MDFPQQISQNIALVHPRFVMSQKNFYLNEKNQKLGIIKKHCLDVYYCSGLL